MAKKTVGAFAPNQKVKLVMNTANHGIPIGTVATVTSCAGVQPTHTVRLREYPNLTFYVQDCALADISKAQLEEDIKNLEEELDTLKSSLEFLNATGQDAMDYDEFKILQVIKSLKTETDDAKLAKKVSKIING